MNNFDKNFLDGNIKLIAGVDEAGRGPLAGPVVAAAVIFSAKTKILGVADSKTLSAVKREELYKKIKIKAVSYSYSVVTVEEIDELNILNASLLAMKQAVEQLNPQPDLVLVDGNKKFNYPVSVIPIVKGDSKSFSIAAASIIAKVERDRIMKQLAIKFPGYNWAQNKGYPTKKHKQSIIELGPCNYHRKTFLKNVLDEKATKLEFQNNKSS